MIRQYASAGAIVVSPDQTAPRLLFLEQVRKTGERQTVAPKGRLESGESPLSTAFREVAEEAGLNEVAYVAFLGRQGYQFIDNDGTPATKTVDWFLFTAPDTLPATPLASEGFVGVQWCDFDAALAIGTHAQFREYVERAKAIVDWRGTGGLGYSPTLDTIVRRVSAAASELLGSAEGRGLGLCGSGARGDFVPGWSDLDFIAWGVEPASPLGAEFAGLIPDTAAQFGVHASLHFVRSDGDDARHLGPLYDMKLRAILRRTHRDVPVIAGRWPTPLLEDIPEDLPGNLARLLDFARTRQSTAPTEQPDRLDRARRTLSVLCSAGRQIALSLDTNADLRLSAVVAVLEHHVPSASISGLLSTYDRFRQSGGMDLATAEGLAAQAPAAIDELRQLVVSDLTSAKP